MWDVFVYEGEVVYSSKVHHTLQL